ncbi:MAG: MraY family glycosyltransferase [Acidimicrobiales bacterium]|jgi:UDP-GlcNAc:undecaprenyl-phosphate GlcNAc-1-phosphate transferase|nr:MraY family glycosyltransferase [Acidimicrobiales bacterium]MDP7507135.1 MraY family glycosyltransferase [Acidimicrobiales bacterium]
MSVTGSELLPGGLAFALVGGAAAVATAAATPVARRLATRSGVLVAPDDRNVHESPTATLGGTAMLFGLFVGAATAWLLGDFASVFAAPSEMIGVLVAAAVICAVGVVDDISPLSVPAKVAGMVVAGVVLSVVGVSLVVLRIPFFETVILSSNMSALLTVVWVVLIANAVNLIDGLDGLAGGIVAIAAATFLFYAIRLGDAGVLTASSPGALIAVLVVGICVGFLPHNVHPARIFMGDGGALLLGLLMAASTMSVGGSTDAVFSGQAFFFFAPVFIPLFILGVPLFDMAFAIVRRAATRGIRVTHADKDHLHHRLLRLGYGHRRAVWILWAWTALLSGFVLWPTYTGSGDAIVPIGIAAVCLLLFTVFHPRLRDSVLTGSPDDHSDGVG